MAVNYGVILEFVRTSTTWH